MSQLRRLRRNIVKLEAEALLRGLRGKTEGKKRSPKGALALLWAHKRAKGALP